MEENKVFAGRPSDKRTDTEEAVYDFLDSTGVNYERTDHAAAMTMEDCVSIGNILGIEICKNLFLCNRQKTNFYLLLMPGDKEFRTKDLSAQIGSARLSFGDHDKMKEYLDILPGSMSVLGLMNDTENRVLISGDPIQQRGRIYMFGSHRNMEQYIQSLEHLETHMPQFDEIWPSHADLPIPPDTIQKLHDGTKEILAGNVQGEPEELHGQSIVAYDLGFCTMLCDK